jgi:Restriction endonuclease
MSDIRTIDMRNIENAFGMGSGYVLDFSDRTMSVFFEEELNLDIDADQYRDDGGSKAKRLRCFLRKVDNATAAKTLRALLAYSAASASKGSAGQGDGPILELIAKFEGGRAAPAGQAPTPATNRDTIAKLRRDLVALWQLPPQPRGFAFEVFLKDAFDLYGLRARASFRNRGEQIDGSFDLDGATYLLEAKWHEQSISAADLHTFEGKLSQKAAWARGLFISWFHPGRSARFRPRQTHSRNVRAGFRRSL